MKSLSIKQRLEINDPLFSVEFFPPKSDDAAQQLLSTAERLQTYNPDFVSITYGAGGSTRSRTLNYARKLHEDYGYAVMPHLTCVGHSRDELKQTIAEFKAAGLKQIMALRGDPPKGETDFTPHPDGLSYANELVQLIREVYPECDLGVAGYPEKHPEAPSPELDLLNLKRKVDAGATFITTQLFFDNEAYFTFVENCRRAGITVPIMPGLMSVASHKQALRFCDMCGTSIPAALNEQLIAAGDDKAAVEAVGIEWSYQQARELLEKGAPGIHLYILNRAGPAITLMEKLQSAGFYR
ncbi:MULTISPECIES: methylenetetrahydrofolate reductase [NAD(P)H] [unclassified Lentimonas]|uniref:methylenetetrahydrofolate reductase [NAD(P)H] n=1 Tax=unclassified Lentimonas TaxID=2630993 RepID=UPI001325DBBF|nr:MULTISPECIES: methylenetetrahydrofolate reductase [NAD(P)H] [unclassified Lentimonas]CAA6678427.1 5,10-methylenetetrahydrofolate reductase (EC [Lentimonas sp. CC4]CAA6685519.1 5,10-methylenetetrahydrofolate reductase (EC [Lentimonas sp. CC6]CAA6690497.1 5,10-methylenetetrahydrofolate reductase (EC [Lentimonas sp. CC10]CAA6693230.1 5,10-methylenetetrahydrofolate reductase (EC [Lentimonas sp. CC19]CAA7068755.1 5,10-methylenetetrahydrofolate reductase (EC [Lentimonas sp. CC11]